MYAEGEWLEKNHPISRELFGFAFDRGVKFEYDIEKALDWLILVWGSHAPIFALLYVAYRKSLWRGLGLALFPTAFAIVMDMADYGLLVAHPVIGFGVLAIVLIAPCPLIYLLLNPVKWGVWSGARPPPSILDLFPQFIAPTSGLFTLGLLLFSIPFTSAALALFFAIRQFIVRRSARVLSAGFDD